MAVAHRSFSNTTYASRTNNTITAPSGIQDGDILLLGGVVGAATEAPDPTPPSGFTAVPLTTGTWPIDNSDAGSFNLEFRVWYKVASGESGNYTVTHSAASSQHWMACYSGGDTADPIGEATAQGGNSQTSTALGVTPTVDESMVVFASHDWGSLTNNLTPPTGSTPTFTERMDTTVCYVADGVLTTAGATGNKSHTNNNDNAVVPFAASLIVINAAPGADTEQEGFRWRADDGDEDGASWLAAQDSNTSIALDTNLRLRTLIDTTGDAGNTQYRLEYTEEGAGDWRPIGVGLAGSTPTVVGWGSAALSTNDPSVDLSSGSWTPAENDVVVFFIASTTTLAVTGTAGWVNPLGGTTSVNSDAHGYCAAYHLVTAGEAGGSTTFTATNYLAAAETGNVVAVALRGVNPTTPVNAAASGFDSGNTATPSVLTALTGANQPTTDNGLVVRGVSQDSTGSYTTPASHTSVTSNNTNQINQVFTRDTATTGGVDVAATNATPDAGDEYCAITIAFTPAPGPAAINFATSTQYADGAATTAQLTAPAGKTTSDFDAGVMVEAQALADAVDTTADDYTEIEWALVAVSGVAADTDVYEFRVTRNGGALTTYTVTPELTIGAASLAPATVAATVTIGTPTLTATATVTPTTVAVTVSVGTPAVTATAVPTPATVAAVATVGAPSILTGGDPSPTTVQATATVGAPTISVSRVATPATVQAVATVGAPTLQISVLPATVTATVSVGTPTATATANLTPATVTAVATIGASLPSGIRSIAQENALTGYASTNWDIATGDFGSTNIFGFCVEQTLDAGGDANFKVHCTTGWTYKIVRLGYYGGDGARLVDSGTGGAGTTQSEGTLLTAGEGGTGSRDCSNWTNNFTWTVPADATPGIYLLVMDRTAGGRSHARFIVRNPNAVQADLLYISPLSTHVAYNAFGTKASPTSGRSLYGAGTNVFDQGNTRAWTVTTQRPETTRSGVVNTFFAIEYPTIRFLERNGINVDYCSDQDTGNDPSLMLAYGAVMLSGHDEYWSQARRDAWDDYLAAGGHAFIASGNTMLWRTRHSGTGNHLMLCYKDSHTLDGQSYSGTGEDPVTWTGTWRDTRTGDGAVNDSENRSIGLWFIANGIRNDEFGVRFQDKGHPMWRDCPSIQALTTGQTATISTDILGFEWDGIRPSHANNPPTLKAISQSANVNLTGQAANANGSWYDSTLNPAVHNVVMFRGAGGGLVVNLGVNNWGWALDSTHDLGGASSPDNDAQQATLNVLTDMGAAPTTTMAGLTTPTSQLDDWFTDVTPTTVTAVVTVGAPTVATGTSPTPATVTAVTTVGTPTRTATAAVAPSTVHAVASVGAPVVVASATPTAPTVMAVATVGAPSITATAAPAPVAVVAVVSIGTPSVSGGSGAAVTPATVQAVATVGAPVVSIPATVAVVRVLAVVTVGAPSVQPSISIGPTTVLALAAVGTPTIMATAAAAVLTVVALVIIGTPPPPDFGMPPTASSFEIRTTTFTRGITTTSFTGEINA